MHKNVSWTSYTCSKVFDNVIFTLTVVINNTNVIYDTTYNIGKFPWKEKNFNISVEGAP